MPKIIPDLGSRILQAAARQFESKGYHGTDMKSLAVDLGISVGTLYNYYASKPDLFLAVSLLWKQELGARLIQHIDTEASATVRLRHTLWTLFEDMESYTGLWKEFSESGAKFERHSPVGGKFREDNDQLNRRIQNLFREVWKDRPFVGNLAEDPANQLAQVVVRSIMQLVMNPTEDPEACRRFVEQWIDFLAPLPGGLVDHKKGL